MSAEELRALDAHEQLVALNDLFREIKRIADEKRGAEDRLADAEISLLHNPKDTDVKASKINARRDLKKLQHLFTARKYQAGILQTQLNIQSRISV